MLKYIDAKGLDCPKPILKTKEILDLKPYFNLAVIVDNEAAAINVSNFLENKNYSVKTSQSYGEWLVLASLGEIEDIIVYKAADGWHSSLDEEFEGPLNLNNSEDTNENVIEDINIDINKDTNKDINEDIIELTEFYEEIDSNLFLNDEPLELLDSQIINKNEIKKNGQFETVLIVSSRYMGEGDLELGTKLAVSFFDTLAALKEKISFIAFYNSGVFLSSTESDIIFSLEDLESQGTTIVSCGVCLEYYNLKNKLKVGRVGNMYEIIQAQKSAFKILRM